MNGQTRGCLCRLRRSQSTTDPIVGISVDLKKEVCWKPMDLKPYRQAKSYYIIGQKKALAQIVIKENHQAPAKQGDQTKGEAHLSREIRHLNIT